LPETAIMRKWWDYMADIMQTGEGNVPVAHPLVPVFHLP
jgi:L-rhamnose mutarotase